jgi:hypothetical protein
VTKVLQTFLKVQIFKILGTLVTSNFSHFWVSLLPHFTGIVKIKLMNLYPVVEKASMLETSKDSLPTDRWVFEFLTQRQGLQLL